MKLQSVFVRILEERGLSGWGLIGQVNKGLSAPGSKSLSHNLFERRIFLLCREVLG